MPRITSLIVVTSSVTRLIASSRSVRMPCEMAKRRSSSCVAQPTMSRLSSGVIRMTSNTPMRSMYPVPAQKLQPLPA